MIADRETRRKYLQKNHNFICQCSICSLEGQHLAEDEKQRKIASRRLGFIYIVVSDNWYNNNMQMKLTVLPSRYCPVLEIQPSRGNINIAVSIFWVNLTPWQFQWLQFMLLNVVFLQFTSCWMMRIQQKFGAEILPGVSLPSLLSLSLHSLLQHTEVGPQLYDEH